jgi:uncharacterized damage-inducible protein DinB
MTASLTIDELVHYTNGERAKWDEWFASNPPAALQAAVQREGDFPTVWRLMNHIFLVEKRHTQRLKRQSPLDEQTGVAEPDAGALFTYARAVRDELTAFLRSASPADLDRPIELRYRDQAISFTARKLALHIFFHEIRHWAQIATAVRNAGFAPPGYHDLLFSDALK